MEKGLTEESSQLCCSFAIHFVVRDFILPSQLIFNKKGQKDKDLHSRDHHNPFVNPMITTMCSMQFA